MPSNWDIASETIFDAVDTEARFAMVSAGFTVPDPKFTVTRSGWPNYSFELVLSGRGTVCTGGSTLTVGSGDLFILQKGLDHSFFTDPEDPWQKVWFVVNGPMTDGLMYAHNLRQTCVIRDCFSLFPYFAEMLLVSRDYDGGIDVDPITIVSHFNSLLMELDRRVIKQSRRVLSVPSIVKGYLDANVSANITVDELAAVSHCSTVHMARLFKGEFGITPHRYHMAKKVEAAKTMLLSTDLRIRVIGEHLGFPDESYFSTVFRNHTGISPKKFRMMFPG